MLCQARCFLLLVLLLLLLLCVRLGVRLSVFAPIFFVLPLMLLLRLAAQRREGLPIQLLQVCHVHVHQLHCTCCPVCCWKGKHPMAISQLPHGRQQSTFLGSSSLRGKAATSSRDQ